MSDRDTTDARAAALAEFRESLDNLAVIGGFSNHVSNVEQGKPASAAEELASMVHAKMCAHSASLGRLATSGMFDHSAMLAIARMMIEATTMYFYLREEVEPSQWELRHHILMLHDVVNRITLLRSTNSKEETADLRAARLSILEIIKSHSQFLEIGEAQRARIETGSASFVDGMRATAARVNGWDSDRFQSIYSYLSAHVHSLPVSFTRMREHGIDYLDPGVVQLHQGIMAIEVSATCMRRVSLHHMGDNRRHYQSDLVEEMISARDSCAIFG